MDSFWKKALGAVVGSVLANVGVWWIGVSTLTIPSDFPPLAGPGPTIFFTTVGGIGAVVVFTLLRRMSSRPREHFRLVALIVLILSFIPDLLLLSEGAGESVPGVTLPGVALLMVLHLVAAAVIVWALTGGGAKEGRSKDGRSEGRGRD